MPSQVERWLETFMCKQYAEIFGAYGFKTLHSVCQLQIQQLQSMGIPQEHCELIIQNVQILRQSLNGQGQQQYGEEMSSHYGNNRMSQGMQGMGYPDTGAQHQMQGGMNMGYNSGMGNPGSYGNHNSQRSVMMAQQQQYQNQAMYQARQNQQQFNNPNYRPQYPGAGGFPQRGGQVDMQSYGNSMSGGAPSPASSSMYGPRHQYPNQMQGSSGMGQQASVHHSHPHLRNAGQSPQEVANNILHMASASYPSNNTVQVPISKNRSAPYHVPPRSPLYTMQAHHESQQQQQQQHMGSSGSQGQFMYPSSSPHLQQQQQQQQQHTRMSPISPASGVMLPSPHSHHSGHSIPSSSPCSMHSPGMGSIKSPASDMGTGMMRTPTNMIQNSPNSQPVQSPQRGQYPMSSPVNTPHQRMVSPVPVNQQLQVTVPSSACSQTHQGFGRDTVTNMSPSGSQHSQFMASTNPYNSPSGQSGHFSNISSPYTPGSKQSMNSPNQSFSHTPVSAQQYINETAPPSTNSVSHSANATNPLQSLQKLCMLPERQVIDPKSVVNDACAPSPQNNEFPKNLEPNADSQNSDFGMTGRSGESASSDSQKESKDEESKDRVEDSSDSVSLKDIVKQENRGAATSGLQGGHQEEKIDKAKNLTKSDIVKDTGTVNEAKDMKPDNETNQNRDETKPSPVTLVETNTSAFETDVVLNEDTLEKQSSDESMNKSEQEIKCQPKKIMILRAKQEEKDNSVMQMESSENKDDEVTEKKDELPVENAESEIGSANDSHETIEDHSVEMKDDDVHVDEPSQVTSAVESNSADNSNETQVDIPRDETVGNVQSSDVTSKFVADISDSDDDSHLIVRKDIKSTYLKHDRLKSLEIASRMRGRSTGSLSDDLENSDIEYEDHIGCDDIENDLSYMGEKDENELLQETDAPSSNVDMVMDKVLISSPHWKKSKLNNLQVTKNGPHTDNIEIEEVNSKSGMKTRKRTFPKKVKQVNGVHKGVYNLIDPDADECIPSPTGEDFTDSVGLDNGDGTMTVSRTSRLNHRQRKTPLKYTDTSFFQGDFVFVEDEEEEEDELFEPKRKMFKNSIDVNHNTKNDNDIKKKEKTKSDTKSKNESVKDKKQKQNLNVKSKQKLSVDSPVEVKNEEEQNIVIKTKTEQVSEKAFETLDDGNESKGNKFVSQKKQHKIKIEKLSKDTDTNHVISKSAKNETSSRRPSRSSSRTNNEGVTPKCESAVISKNTSSQTPCARKTNCKSIEKESDSKPINGLRKVDKDTRSKGNTNETSVSNKSGDSLPRSKSLTKGSEITEDVIEIDESSDGSECVKQEPVAKKVESVSVQPFKFQIVKDEVTVNLSCDETVSDVKNESIVLDRKVKTEKVSDSTHKGKVLVSKKAESKAPDQKKKKPAVKSGAINKSNPKLKSGSKQKRKKGDDDSDYEVEPKKKSLKSMNLNRTHDLLSSKKKPKKPDKWADFKGPMIQLEGAKDNPEKCMVINEPHEQTGSKKSKSSSQCVSTTIHISHLPSEKSVLIPDNEAEEGTKWSCALCGKHSSFRFLGDLFGPYTVESLSEEMELSPLNSNKLKKRRSEEAQPGSSKQSRTSKRVWSTSKETSMWKEVWVHESCAVWSDGVFLIGSKIYGLQEAVRIASQTPCTHCHEMGAMIGCLNKGCQQKFHHSCSMETDCYLDEENFSLLCPKHKVRKLKQLETAASASNG